MNDSDLAVVDKLVTDGCAEKTEIADESGYHLSTVYRAIERLKGLVKNDNGSVKLASQHLAERLNDAVEDAQETLKQTAETAAHMLDMSEKEVERRGSALLNWMRAYGGEIKDPEDGLPQVEIDRLNGTDPKEAVRELLRAWDAVGRSKRRLKLGEVKYEHPRRNQPVFADIGAVANRRGTSSPSSRSR
jgi:predicted transcriptional regulator